MNKDKNLNNFLMDVVLDVILVLTFKKGAKILHFQSINDKNWQQNKMRYTYYFRCYKSILQILVAFKMLDGMSKNIANDLDGMSMINKVDRILFI